MRTSAIGGLPALGRAESRPAPRCIRGLHEQIAAPAAVTEVVGPLSPSQVPVVGTIFHGGRYRNTRICHSSGHHPVSGKPGKRSAGVTRRRERSERGHEVALTAVRSDRHSPAWGWWPWRSSMIACFELVSRPRAQQVPVVAGATSSFRETRWSGSLRPERDTAAVERMPPSSVLGG